MKKTTLIIFLMIAAVAPVQADTVFSADFGTSNNMKTNNAVNPATIAGILNAGTQTGSWSGYQENFTQPVAIGTIANAGGTDAGFEFRLTSGNGQTGKSGTIQADFAAPLDFSTDAATISWDWYRVDKYLSVRGEAFFYDSDDNLVYGLQMRNQLYFETTDGVTFTSTGIACDTLSTGFGADGFNPAGLQNASLEFSPSGVLINGTVSSALSLSYDQIATMTFGLKAEAGWKFGIITDNILAVGTPGTPVAPEAFFRGAMLGQWTFNDGASSAERLQSSAPAAGMTLSALAIHPDIGDFGTVNSVPTGDDDGMGFGGNNGEMVMFWHRANYTNTNAPVGKATIWGVPGVDAGIDTTVANAPMSFTATADALRTLTVEGLLINNSNGAGGCNAHFQEAGQAAGSANGGINDVLVPLNEPVVIAPGTTKTFTINWSGDALDIKQNINRIDLRGSISSGGAQETVRTKYSSAAGKAAPPSGWEFKWNAPTNWAIGVEGDLSSGAISDTNSWRAMAWSGSRWTPDGDGAANNPPANSLHAKGTGGHPGLAGASRELDRYAIAVFTVDAAGDYQIGQAWIEKASGQGNGMLLKIFAKGQLVKTVECAAGDMAHFEARMEGLVVGDEIAVAVGSDGDPSYDTYTMDYEISRVDPSFDGLLVYDVADYGAASDGTTDDFHAIHAAVDAAIAAGGGIVRFESNATYRIIGDATGDDDVERIFELEGAYNIKLEGNGANLVLHAPDSLANISYCENIQIDGFTIAFDPLPYYQGTVDAIDVGNLTMDITVPSRYVEPEIGTNTAPLSHPFFGRSFIPESPGARAGTGKHLYIDSTETIGGDPRKIRLNLRSDMTSNLQDSSAATEMVVPHIRYGHRGHHSIVIQRSSRVKLSNILYRNTPFFLCAPGGNAGPVTLSNFDILTADPANELFVTWRDGFHVKDNRYGVLIEDGDWHGGAMNDDLFNFAHMMKWVTSVSSNELSLMAANSFGGQHIWQAGDWISIWDPTQKILRGRARIVGPGSTKTWTANLTLDREISANANDWVVNESTLNRGMLVRNCTNAQLGTRTGSARLRTPTRFENNHFDGIYFHLYSTTLHEGPVPRDYHFEDTYFKGAPGREDQPLDITAGKNITFKNCTVDGGQIFAEEASEVMFDGVDWINNTGDVLSLRENTVAYVFNQSSRNGSPVVLADISLASGAQVYLEAPPGYPSPDSGYGDWAEFFNLSGDDAAATNDYDFDGMNNLLEYALGGNPTNADAAAVLPIFGPGQAGDWFYHVYNERTDDSTLTYTVELNTNLVDGAWTTVGLDWVGESGVANDFKTVTNRTDIGSGEFIRLKVEQE